MEEYKVVIIGIAGGTASGKSTIANSILQRVGEENITHIIHDSYYKNVSDEFPLSETNNQPNFDHPDALETELLIQHIRSLQDGKPVEVPIYDFVNHRRAQETHTMPPRPVIIIEGILVLAHPVLRDLFDIKIYVDTPADVRFIRRLKRDIAERGRTTESVISQYLDTVRPMHQAFVEPSKVYADVIIPQGGFNMVAIDLLSERVRSFVHTRGASPLHIKPSDIDG